MTAADDGAAFSAEQQEYLKGLMAGATARRIAAGLPAGPEAATASDPSDLQRAAQDRVLAAGGRLTAEDAAKRARHPLDRYDELADRATAGRFPRGLDVFLTKWFGLFHVAPAQDAFMCRLRIPGGLLTAHQARGVAAIAEQLGAGHADITTRANLQLREIGAAAAPEVLTRVAELGLTSLGAGADNVRNITGSPTAGIDVQELIDTRPYTRALHHCILHHRDLYGLPRKFNIAFDGGGAIASLAETNDIALDATEVADGFGVAPGIYFRLGLGGITGHGDFARPTGVIVPPQEAVAVCVAILRIFIAHGDRTDRTRARLKYLLDQWGMEKFLDAVAQQRGAPLLRVAAAALRPRPAPHPRAHIGVHRQKQEGFAYIGLVVPAARLTTAQLRGLAGIAERWGSGTLRLTVWQNLLLSDIATADLDAALEGCAALGLDWRASLLRGGLVACTGNAGCRFSAGDTKGDAAALAAWLEARITLDQPINIHLTGCPNSCAQHRIADIGLLAKQVAQGEDLVPGYDLYVGGGAGEAPRLGRLLRADVPCAELPPLVLSLLTAWQRRRAAPDEGFAAFAGRHDAAALSAMAAA